MLAASCSRSVGSYRHRPGVSSRDRAEHGRERGAQTFLGRLSGDEFLFLASDIEAAEALAGEICKAVAEPVQDLIRDADVAMDRAKELGRSPC
jgi:hypothetical protein